MPGQPRCNIALNFPNPSRSFDAAKHCVWFWGYDNAREVTFLVNDAVLANLELAMGSAEPEVLAAFDRTATRSSNSPGTAMPTSARTMLC